jgi:hypothetical protein
MFETSSLAINYEGTRAPFGVNTCPGRRSLADVAGHTVGQD